MSLDRPNTVDAIGIEKDTGIAILTIVDSWDWKHEERHLLALQEKLNTYFDFIESGEIYETYPDAAGRKVIIDVIGRFPVPKTGLNFLEKANEACTDLGIKVRNTYYPGSQPQSGA